MAISDFFNRFRPKRVASKRSSQASFDQIGNIKLDKDVSRDLNLAYNDMIKLLNSLGGKLARNNLNLVYQNMLQDSILSSAVKTLCKDTVPRDNSTKRRVSVRSEFKKYKRLVENWLYDVIDIDKKAYAIAFMYFAFGECFIDTGYMRDDFDIDTSKWVVVEDPNVIGAIYDDRGELVGYLDKRDSKNVYIKPPEAFIHIKNSGTFKKEKIKIDVFEDQLISYGYSGEPRSQKVLVEKEYYLEVGSSIFEGIVQDFNTMKLIETAVLLARLTRSPYFRVWNIEVKDADDPETADIIDTYKRKVSEHETLDLDGAKYLAGMKSIPIGGDIFIPTRNGRALANIQPVGIDVNIKDLYDLDYFQRKVLSGLPIPAEYLNLSSQEGGIQVGEGSLNRKSDRYSRFVSGGQDDLEDGFQSAFDFYIEQKGYYGMVGTVNPHLSRIFTYEEEERESARAARISNISDIAGLFDRIQELPDWVDKEKWFHYVFDKELGVVDLINVIDVEKLKKSGGDDIGSGDYGELGEDLGDRELGGDIGADIGGSEVSDMGGGDTGSIGGEAGEDLLED